MSRLPTLADLPSIRSRISVFSYTDYRIFLDHYFRYTKAISPRFSFRVFADRIGMKSRSYLKMVMIQKRHLGDEYAFQIAHEIFADPKEIEYFLTLVSMNKLSAHNLKDQLEKRLKELSSVSHATGA